MREVDVAIVGGGAAAASAALTLAETGVRCVALTPAHEHGDRPGESLAPAGVRVLTELGIAERCSSIFRAQRSTYAAWGANALAQSHAIANVDGTGWVIDRSAFDAVLRTELAKAIETIDTTVRAVERDADRWLLHGEGHSVRARFVIDCSGRRAIVGRTQSVRCRADRMIAAYAFLAQKNDDVETTRATMIEATEAGWWYATLLPGGRMAVALFSDADVLPRGLTRNAEAWRTLIQHTQFVSRWLASAAFVSQSPPRLASAATTWLQRAGGDGWVAAGDAAAAFDPLSSHGLSSALHSGRRAANVARAALAGDREPLSRYVATTEAAVRAFLEQRAALYGREGRFPNATFWARRGR